MLIHRITLSLSLTLCILSPAMQPLKTPQDLLVGAAGAGNQKGLNFHLITQKMSPDTKNKSGQSALGMAAGNGQVEAVQFLLAQGANPNIQDNSGLTPLAWAAFTLNQQKTEKDYETIIKALLQRGARLDIYDINGLSVLHGAARSGNTGIVKLLLDNGARKLVNHEGSTEKGRTPIAEALRASRDAIIHVDLENKDIVSQAEFGQELEDAIAQLRKKEERKLLTAEIIGVINLLKAYGANTNTVDALGHRLDYYIDEVQVISEFERKQLLNALNISAKPRIIQYQQADLAHVISGLENFKSLIQKNTPVLARKIQMLIWTIQAAQKEVNPGRQYDMLRIGMALIAKIKELLKDALADKSLFADVEAALNTYRTVLRDNALVISGKAQLTPIQQPSSAPKPVAPAAQTKPAATQPQPRQTAQPAVSPVAHTTVVPQKPERGILIVNAINFSNQPASLRISFKGDEIRTISIKQASPMQSYAITNIEYNLTRADVASVTTGSDQKIFEIPSSNTSIIEVYDVKADTLGTFGAVDKYVLSTITINDKGIISLSPYQKPEAAPAPVQPKPSAAPVATSIQSQISINPDSLFITDIINYSNAPARLVINYKRVPVEFLVDSAKSNTVPSQKEVMRAGHAQAPLYLESFNQSATLSIIPADASTGKPIQVKRQILNSAKPITYWNMSDVRQSKIIIESNGDIKLIPDKKVTIIDAQKK